MAVRTFPERDQLNICFAHPSYRLSERFALRNTGLNAFEVRTHEQLQARIGEADVLLVSGMLWRNEYLEQAPRLVFLQSISAGMDHYDKDAFRQRGIRLTSAQGTNAVAVAEHALALILALARKIPMARDNQAARHWRSPISDLAQREDELSGKTLLVVGFGRIGQKLATLAKAFGMRVIAVKRDVAHGTQGADQVVAQQDLLRVLPEADFVALTCPLTPETENLIDAAALAAMKPAAQLINVARGRVVHEPSLIAALKAGGIAGAALDCVWEEPLPAESPLWDMGNVLITPHVGGETAQFEDNLLDVLLENLDRLARGQADLVNATV